MPPRRIHNNHLKLLCSELLHSRTSDGDRIGFGVGTKERYASLRSVLLQLIEGARTECVGAH